MRERPILFSSPMVRAILAGTKSQTRRVVKPQFGKAWGQGVTNQRPESYSVSVDIADATGAWRWLHCPYGKPGDELWVRESIRLKDRWNDGRWADAALSVYCADETPTCADAWPWKTFTLSPIHCPIGLSRITLRVTGVRVERLQDISEADVVAEGIQKWPLGYRVEVSGAPKHESLSFESAQNAYRWLWDSINGPGSWDANPWVWVIEFRRVDA